MNTEISQEVKNKVAEAIELWADEILKGKPAVLAHAVYYTLIKILQEETDKINNTFTTKVTIND